MNESQTKGDTCQKETKSELSFTDDLLLVDEKRATVVAVEDDDDDGQQVTEAAGEECGIVDYLDNDFLNNADYDVIDDVAPDLNDAGDSDKDYVPGADGDGGQSDDDVPVSSGPWRATELSTVKLDKIRSSVKVTPPQTIKTEKAKFKLPQILTGKGTRISIGNKMAGECDERRFGPCRCCLKKGLHNVADVLTGLQCLNLQPSRDARLPELVCADCAEFLLRARQFRDMAARAERVLLESLCDTAANTDTGDDTNNSTTVKIEFISKNGQVKDIDIPVSSLNESRVVVGGGGERRLVVDGGGKRRLVVVDGSLVLRSESDHTTLHLDMALHKGQIKSEHAPDMACEAAVAMEADDDDGGAERPASRLSDCTDVDPKEHNLFPSDMEIQSMIWKMRKDQANMASQIRENLILLMECSTILPFASTKGSMFDCIFCDGAFQIIDELRRHMEEKHVDEDTKSKQEIIKIIPQAVIRADISDIKCRLCDEPFKNIDDLAKHLVQIHERKYHELSLDPPHNIICFDMSSNALKCLTCEKEFPTFKKLRTHVNKHFGMFLCHLCGNKFLYPNAYSKHMQDHRKVKVEIKHICEKCGEEFRTKRELSYHDNRAHYDETLTARGEKRKCYIDEMLLPDDDSEGTRIFECVICNNGTTFTSKNAAYMHRIGHLNNTRKGPFQCEQCGYTNTTKSHMKYHLRRHYGVKYFMCETCSKKFTTKNKLSEHVMKKHLNIRYQCPMCATTLSSKTHVRRHVNLKHPGVKVDFST